MLSTCSVSDSPFSCGGVCIDIWEDPDNCGKCGKKCPKDEVCHEGKCSLWGSFDMVKYMYICTSLTISEPKKDCPYDMKTCCGNKSMCCRNDQICVENNLWVWTCKCPYGRDNCHGRCRTKCSFYYDNHNWWVLGRLDLFRTPSDSLVESAARNALTAKNARRENAVWWEQISRWIWCYVNS